MKLIYLLQLLFLFASTAQAKTESARDPNEDTRLSCIDSELIATAPEYVIDNIVIHHSLPNYELRVVVDEHRNSFGDKKLLRLELKNKENNEIQAVGGEDLSGDAISGLVLPSEYSVLVCDVNFDGYQDLFVYSGSGTPNNVYYHFVLFDPAVKKFNYNSISVAYPSLDMVRHEVVGGGSSGCCYSFTSRHKVEGQSIRLLSEESIPNSRPLCLNDEIVAFSCATSRLNKQMSICVSPDFGHNNGYIVYRFGASIYNVELEFPKNRSSSHSAFNYQQTLKGTGKRAQSSSVLSFNNDGVLYSVYRDEIGGNPSEQGVIFSVKNKKTKVRCVNYEGDFQRIHAVFNSKLVK